MGEEDDSRCANHRISDLGGGRNTETKAIEARSCVLYRIISGNRLVVISFGTECVSRERSVHCRKSSPSWVETD